MSKYVNKYTIGLGILLVAGGIMLQTTWNNKSWLITKIIENGGEGDEKSLATKSKGELRKQLLKLS